jgi:hypothetical protein
MNFLKSILFKIRNLIINIIVNALEAENSNFVNFLNKKSHQKTLEILNDRMANSLFFTSKFELWDFITQEIINYETKNHLKIYEKASLLEFGVGAGISISYMANKLKKNNLTITGFDSFYGNPEVWPGTNNIIGSSNQFGKIPNNLPENVFIVEGKIEETLSKYLLDNQIKKISFVHIDVNIYSTSNFILKTLKPFMQNGSIILFDELVNYPFWWLNGEYKSLIENFDDSEYEYIAFDRAKKAAIRIK